MLATLLFAATPGCSLIFTKGPQPELQPPPECTSSVAAPVADTVLATLSIALFGLGVTGAVASLYGGAAVSCPVSGCNNGSEGVAFVGSLSALALGAAMGALFITSAVNGYEKTSACRASVEANALLPRPKALLFPASPAEACEAVRDAPRVCPGLARRDESPGGKWPP